MEMGQMQCGDLPLCHGDLQHQPPLGALLTLRMYCESFVDLLI